MSKATGTARRKPRVFLSYSRNDFDFADQLEKALLYGGFSLTACRHKILVLDDWQHWVSQLIRESEAVVCVLSSSSATSEICRWELEEAARLGKRTVCVSCHPVDQVGPPVRTRGPERISFYADREAPGSGFGAGLHRLGVALTEDLGSKVGYPHPVRAAEDHQEPRNIEGASKRAEEVSERNAEIYVGTATELRARIGTSGRRTSSPRIGVLALLVCAAVVSGAGYHVLQQRDALRQKDDAEKKLLATQEQIALVKASKREIERDFREGLKADSYFRADQAAHTGADSVLRTLLALEGLRDDTS